MHHEHGARGFSFDIEEAPARAPDLGRLDLDWSDLGAPSLAPAGAPQEATATGTDAGPLGTGSHPAAVGTPPALGAGTPLMPHAAAASRALGSPPTSTATRPLLAAFSAPVEATLGPKADSESTSPVVRRLRFPTATLPQTKASPRPSTRFADSVGRIRPTADSTNDLTIEPSAPPEDLPGRRDAAAEASADAWDEPAPPALLLRKASLLLSSAKDTALDLGGRSLESGRVLAGQMSDALRERLERKPNPTPAQTATQAPAQPHSFQSANDRPHLPSSRRSVRALARQGAGPILALVAALGMFLGSRHIIGSGSVGLSKTSPAVPSLGEVSAPGDGPRASTPSVGSGAGEATKLPSGPPPAMATEFAPLPPGMAWPGKGLLEVVTSEDELVYVDGVFTGRGPLRRVPVTPGEHEVSIRKEGSERHGAAKVEPGRTTRAIFRAN